MFFAFYPHEAGHQYGPRYWYAAWPTVALTIGTGLARPVPLARVALAQLVFFAGFTIGYALFLRTYIDARRGVYVAVPPKTPAVVLVPSRRLALSSWQSKWFYDNVKDYTWNGLDFDGPVLYGIDNRGTFREMACSMPGRHVYVWHEGGTLQEIDCIAHRSEAAQNSGSALTSSVLTR